MLQLSSEKATQEETSSDLKRKIAMTQSLTKAGEVFLILIHYLFLKELLKRLLVRKLTDMGFPSDKAQVALEATNGNIEAAAFRLLDSI